MCIHILVCDRSVVGRRFGSGYDQSNKSSQIILDCHICLVPSHYWYRCYRNHVRVVGLTILCHMYMYNKHGWTCFLASTEMSALTGCIPPSHGSERTDRLCAHASGLLPVGGSVAVGDAPHVGTRQHKLHLPLPPPPSGWLLKEHDQLLHTHIYFRQLID